MPFDQNDDAATREAATARVLQRRATHPKDRHVFTVVANEFDVGQQSLRAWVAATEAESEKPAKKARRPRFSPVVSSRIEPARGQDSAGDQVLVDEPDVAEMADVADMADEPDVAAGPDTVPAPGVVLAQPDGDARDDVAALEAQVAALRRGNDALKDAMRALLGP